MHAEDVRLGCYCMHADDADDHDVLHFVDADDHADAKWPSK